MITRCWRGDSVLSRWYSNFIVLVRKRVITKTLLYTRRRSYVSSLFAASSGFYLTTFFVREHKGGHINRISRFHPFRKERQVDLVIVKQAVYNIQIDARCTYSNIPRDVESYKLLFISCNISTVLDCASLVCISVEKNRIRPPVLFSFSPYYRSFSLSQRLVVERIFFFFSKIHRKTARG